MSFQKKTYKVHGVGTQHIIKVFGYPIVVSLGDYDIWFRFGKNEKGFSITSKPGFSLRNGRKKSLKIGKYYITKIK
jgi:hypothetical protein